MSGPNELILPSISIIVILCLLAENKHPFSLSDSVTERVFCVKDFGFYLIFDHYINITIGRAITNVGFVKSNTSFFRPSHDSVFFHFSLVNFVYFRMWHSCNVVPYLAKDQLRIETVQNRFLSRAAFILKISYAAHSISLLYILSSKCSYSYLLPLAVYM